MIMIGEFLTGQCLFFTCSDTNRFWDSKVAELCNWKDMANLYGADYFSEDFSSYYSLVSAEVQTMDCSMIQFFLSMIVILW